MRTRWVSRVLAALLLVGCDGSTASDSDAVLDATSGRDASDANSAGDTIADLPDDAAADADAFCMACSRSLEAGCTDPDGGWTCPRDYAEWCAADAGGGFYWGCDKNIIAAGFSYGVDCAFFFAFDPITQKLIALINDCIGPFCVNGDPGLCIPFCCDSHGICPSGPGAPCPTSSDH